MAKVVKLEDFEAAVAEALRVIAGGGVVALPTETFYGLAADPFQEKALKRLYRLKKRPEEKPILLLLGDEAQLFQVVKEVPPLARKLMRRFWPGPLTLVLPARERLPLYLTAGTGKVAVRLTSHPVPRLLAQKYGRPLTGTSANLSGRPPATTPNEVLAMLPEVDLVLAGGSCAARAPSTIVLVTQEEVRLLRAGAIPWREIAKTLKGEEGPPRPEGGRRGPA